MERVQQAIYLIRGQKVMLDKDLARLYGVETRVLNQAVSETQRDFRQTFMFELTREEIMGMSQSVISSELKLFQAIRQLMAAPQREPKKIGFQLKEKRAVYAGR